MVIIIFGYNIYFLPHVAIEIRNSGYYNFICLEIYVSFITEIP